MFRKILSLSLVLLFIASADIIKKEYSFKAPRVRNGIAYLEGGRSALIAFGPQVAVFPSKVLLPLGQQAKSISIEYGNLVEVPGEYYLKPFLPAYQKKGQQIMVRQDMQPLVDAIYQKDELFPGIQKKRGPEKTATQFLCGASICSEVLTPVQYNPVRERLYYFDRIRVTIETEDINPRRDVAAYVGTPFSKSRIYQIVDNKEAANSLPLTPKGADDYEYAIISRPDLVNNWTDLIEFNTRRGIRTVVHNISTIQQTGTGADLAEKVRNWIKSEYEDHKIVFAVLGGDVASGSNNMPVRLLYAKFYDHNPTPDRLHEISPAADMYFGTLDGNWNDNNNNRWGEPGEEDMFWEVFVSRFPVDDASQLASMINKTIKYSEEPVRESACSFLGLGEYLWTNAGVDVWGAMSIDQYIGYKTNNGFHTYGITDNYTITRLDDRSGGGDGSWDYRNLTTTFNQCKAAWVDHDGHGNQSIAFGMSQSNISSVFQNNGVNANYFIGITGACSPGKFHTTANCFMEELVFTARAAVAAISNNEYGFGDDDGDNSPTGVPYRFIHDALFNSAKRVPFFEAMHDMGKEAVADIVVDPNALDDSPYFGIIRYCCYNTNMFGDPALSVWTDTPQDLAQPFSFTATASQFTMETPPYTWVAIADASSGDIITTQLTGYNAGSDNSFDPQDSTCTINDDAYKSLVSSNSTIKVYVKAHNYIATSFDVPISTGVISRNSNVRHAIKTVRGQVSINFSLPADEFVTLSLFNSKGVLVKSVAKGSLQAGNHSFTVNNTALSNGIYYLKLITDSADLTESFVVVQ